jgi:hypothetical protein
MCLFLSCNDNVCQSHQSITCFGLGKTQNGIYSSLHKKIHSIAKYPAIKKNGVKQRNSKKKDVEIGVILLSFP